MNDLYLIAGAIIAAMFVGAGLVRYGIGLGQKLTIAAQNDLPIDKQIPTLLQDHTGGSDNE